MRSTWLLTATLLMGVSAWGPAGCKGKEKEKEKGASEVEVPGGVFELPGVTCLLPVGVVDEIRAVKETAAVPRKKTAAWLAAVRHRCNPWPRFMDVAFFVAEGASSQERWAAFGKLLPRSRRAHAQAHEEICPGYAALLEGSSVPTDPSDLGAPLGLARAIYKGCRFERLGLFSVKELDENLATYAYAAMMFTMLRKGGMTDGLARTLSRALFLMGPPKPVPQPKVTLQIRANALLLQGKVVTALKGGRVPGAAKRDGPEGFFIEPVFQALKREVEQLKRSGVGRRHRFQGELTVAGDKTVTYRLLAEGLYSASQAGFDRFTFRLVKAPGRADEPLRPLPGQPVGGPWLSGKPKSKPGPACGKSPGAKQILRLTLHLTNGGIFLRSNFGLECPRPKPGRRPCFPFARHGVATTERLKQVQHHLWYLFANKYHDGKHYFSDLDRHALTIRAAADVRYGTLIRVLDAIREIPRDAAQPPVPANLPRAGCTVYGMPSGGTRLPRMSAPAGYAEACLYYRITLTLGGP